MLLIFIGLFISSIYASFCLSSKEGSEPRINPTIFPIMYKGMIIIPYNRKNAIHLHHWILYLFVCIFSFFIYINRIFIGFSFGLIIQGFKYNDRLKFICKNPYN